jgi:biotin synthase
MCYAIPGRVDSIDGRVATIDYFGEKRRAYVDLMEGLNIGDNVYAQGGFVIRKISGEEAKEVLNIWHDIFFKLKEQDKKLAGNPKNLYERANAIRQKHQDNSCCVHGIIEFSNYCRCDCHYCGIRKGNRNITRYRMEIPDILSAVDEAVKLGFQALVLQSGEDPYYDDAKLEQIVKEIRARHPVLIFMSVGERSVEAYQKMYNAGARGALIRFETSNEGIYNKIKSGGKLDARLNLIRELRKMGYLIVSGFLIGLPGQKNEDIMRDIKMTADLCVDLPAGQAGMFSFGPFIPHPDTPLSAIKPPTQKKVFDTIANARIMNPDAKILVTTALETLWGLDGAKAGLMAGANSLMINVTPQRYRKMYDIYPNRFGTELDVQEHINMVIELLRSIGRAPTDLSVN